MKNNSTLKLVLAVLVVALVVLSTAVVSLADTGPKPSVNIIFENLDEQCYATLLSKVPSTGPYSYINRDEDLSNAYPSEKIFRAFSLYDDSDHYYFLNTIWEVGNGKELNWGYYPPEEFKVLIYFPETGRFAVTEPLKRVAFDTYYNVSLIDREIDGVELDKANSSDKRAVVRRLHPYVNLTLMFVARLIFTLVVELITALFFKLWRGKTVLLILAANLVTQIFLNVVLLFAGAYMVLFWVYVIYVLLEIGIAALEAWFYVKTVPKVWNSRKGFNAASPEGVVLAADVPSAARLIIYAVVANVLSFASGWIITLFQ